MSKKIISLFLVIVMLMGLAVPAMASTTPEVQIVIGEAEGSVGDTVAVPVSIISNVGLAYIYINSQLTYGSNLIPISAEGADGVDAELQYGDYVNITSYNTLPVGTTKLATIKFQISDGATDEQKVGISTEDAESLFTIFDEVYTPVSYTVVPGKVTVTAAEGGGGENPLPEPAEHDISTGALAITENGNYTVTGTTTANNISVAENVTATITLKDASIQLSDGSGVSGGDHSNMDGAGTAAIAIAQGANVTLILEGSNSLQGGAGRTAIEVMGEKVYDKETNGAIEQTPATLTIKGDGSLAAQGGNSAAGIGGSFCMNAGIINIESGTITATAGGGAGGDSGAGIGGGHAGNDRTTGKQYGTFKEINISGGTVKADGVRLGAGIGAGAHGSGTSAVINITGGVVTALGGTYRQDPGDGIGLAHGGSSKTPPQVNISGNAVVNASSINTKNSSQGAGKTAITGGVVISDKGSTYTVYGNTTIGADLSVNNLTFGDSGYTLIVPTNVTLTITGSAIGTGTIKLEGGMLEGEDKLADTITLDKGPYKMVLEVSNNAPVYGDTITLTATAKTREDVLYSDATGAAVFTVGGEAVGEVSFTDGVAVMEYTVAVPAGNQLIKASATFEGITYTDSVAVTVAKAEQPAPVTAASAAGTSYGSITLNANTDEGYGAAQYAYVEKPTEGEAEAPTNWQDSTELTGLKAGTTYIVYARFAGNDCYNPSPAGNGVEITTTAMDTMTAPVLPTEGHTVSYKTITLAAPAASEVYPEATVEYRMSADDGATWGEWQSSTEFSGLTSETTYKFQARYVITAYSHYSEAGEAITLTTIVTPKYNVSLRVIGASEPTGTVKFSRTSYDYGGSEYQNWVKTTHKVVDADTTAKDLIGAVLTENGITYDFDVLGGKITSPAELGPVHDLYGTQYTSFSYWYITVYNNGELVEETQYYKDYELQDGDQVIFHYTFQSQYETTNGKYNTRHPEIVQKYMQVLDLTDADIAAVNDVIDLIASIGRVTPTSGDAITAARAAYDALNDDQKANVTNYETLTAAEAEFGAIGDGSASKLPNPTISAGNTGLYSIELTVGGLENVDADYTIVYSASVDGENWGAWQTSKVFDKLLPAATYHFRAMAQTNDWTAYSDSEIGSSVEITTAGGDAEAIEVATKEELATALAGAKTDGTLTVIDFKKNIVINDIKGENWTVALPEGANILMTSSNGSSFHFNECGGGSAILVYADTTVTVRGMTFAALTHTGVPNAGVGENAGGNTPGNAWHSALRMMASGAVVNLDNVEMYNDSTSKGVVQSTNSGTLNVYSGVYRGWGIENYVLDVFDMSANSTVNIIPTGDILIEGDATIACSINLLPVLATPVSGAAINNGSYTAMSGAELTADTLTYSDGLRINTGSATKVPPVALDAPVVAAAGAENAADADVTYTAMDDTIVLTVDRDGKDDNALIRIQSDSVRGKYWHSFSDVIGEDRTGLNNTFTYTGLTKDTEYTFTIRYASLDSSYTDAETVVKITTTFTPVVLAAPALSDQAEKSHDTITLAAPNASTEDTTATFEYRISENGETWGEWQASAVFENLQPGTTYYFQARYKAVHKYWLDSAESNTVEIKTSAATLAAPALSAEGAVITAHTIELAAVAASEQDSAAVVMYYMSTDGQTWGDGQQSRTFTGLEGNTKYYFAAQYISSDNNKYLDSAMSEAIEISTAFDENAPIFVVGSVTGRAGGTVDVTVDMKNNPGIVNVKLNVSYDQDKLELVGVKDAELLPNFTKSQNYTVYPYVVYWEDSTAESNITANGTLVTLTFKVKETCPEGSTAEVSVSYNANEVYDVNMDNVEFAIANGGVTVEDHNWSAVTYTWAADHLTCTATRECTDEGCDVAPETETVNATKDETPASCAAPGKIVYTAEFTNTAFKTQTHTEPLEQDDHIWVEVSGGDNAALVKTCTLGHTDEVDVSESTPVITVADVLSNNKNEIKVAVSVKNNPGFKAMSFALNYDGSKLELLGAENKTTLTSFERSGNVITIGGAGENADYTANGDIVILTFKALADCEDASVALTYKIAEVYNAEAEEVLFAIDNGKVSAADYIAGDVNDDSKVDLKDVTYLRRHLAAWNGYKSIVKFAADVDGDGVVDQKDVAYLLRHVAEYEGYEKLGR